MNTIKTGTVAILAPVMIISHCTPASPEKNANPSGRVRISVLSTTISGQRNAPQFPINVKIPNAATADLTNGNAIRKKMPNSF